MSDSFRRSLETERDITQHAARAVGVNSDAIIRHAETRALKLSAAYSPDPMLVAVARDFARDVREELADARNYVLWWLQQHPEHGDRGRRSMALSYIVAAYELWRD